MAGAALTRAEILDRVSVLARTELDHEGELRPETRLVEDLQLDSIRLLTLATAVEDEFRICLDEEDEQSISSVEDLVALIESKLAMRNQGAQKNQDGGFDAESGA